MPPVAMMPQRRVKGAMVAELSEEECEELGDTLAPTVVLGQVSSSTGWLYLGRHDGVRGVECHVEGPGKPGRRSCRGRVSGQARALDRRLQPATRHVRRERQLRNSHATIVLPRWMRRAPASHLCPPGLPPYSCGQGRGQEPGARALFGFIVRNGHELGPSPSRSRSLLSLV